MKISFGPFILDSGRRRLTGGGRPLQISPKAFNLLCVLAEQRPNVVEKATLMDALWPDTVVVEANLNVLISEIRAALSDRRHAYVETAHGVGFAFVGEVQELADVQPRHASGVRFWLAWNERTFVLEQGTNVIGRDPACEVWLDESGVSRQHASIRVVRTDRLAELEDLGSTNGTYLGERRVSSPTALADGDVIRIGARELTFRAWLNDKPRPTERIRR